MNINIDMLAAFSNAFGPSGFEDEIAKEIARYAKDFALENDAMNNIFARFKTQSNTKRPVIMLDAHTDEVGFMVQAIQPNGLLSIIALGGFDVTSIPAHSFIIRNSFGQKFRAISSSKPVHFLTPAQRAASTLEIEGLFLDVGASSREEIEQDFNIQIGDPIMLDATFEYNPKNGICYGKAFDDRAGCAAVLHTMQALQKSEADLAVEVVGSFSSQEEVGTRGAATAAATLRPDLAIVFEGSPADDTFFAPGLAQSALKKGVQIRHMDSSYVANPVFVQTAKQTAQKHNIPYQTTVRRGGGTNAGKISLAYGSIPVLVLGIPTRYVHTHYGYCAVQDIEAMASLATHLIQELTPNTIATIKRDDLLTL